MFVSPTKAEPTVIGNGDVRAVSYGNDRGLFVEFHTEDVYQEFESEQEGRPIFKQVPFISIYVPGDKTKKVTRPVRTTWFGDTPPDTERFPAQWAAYQQGTKAMDEVLAPGVTAVNVVKSRWKGNIGAKALLGWSRGELVELPPADADGHQLTDAERTTGRVLRRTA